MECKLAFGSKITTYFSSALYNCVPVFRHEQRPNQTGQNNTLDKMGERGYAYEPLGQTDGEPMSSSTSTLRNRNGNGGQRLGYEMRCGSSKSAFSLG